MAMAKQDPLHVLDLMVGDTLERVSAAPSGSERIDGVAMARLVTLQSDSIALVTWRDRPAAPAFEARLLTHVTGAVVGAEVALIFERGDPTRPLVLGIVQAPPGTTIPDPASGQGEHKLDAETVMVRAEREIVLRCGDASITLRRDGRVVVRGAYVETRSRGVNRIKGGSVQIN